MKHPIVGDPLYGQTDIDKARFLDKDISKEERIEKSGASRLMLHANELCFTHDSTFCIKSKANFRETFSFGKPPRLVLEKLFPLENRHG